jgi:hypothetical protein
LSSVKCMSCNGSGITSAFVDCSDGTGHLDTRLRCERCDGTGVLTAERREAMAAGARLRSERIRRRLTLRAASKRCGIGMVEFSAMERGRLNITDRVWRVIEGEGGAA